MINDDNMDNAREFDDIRESERQWIDTQEMWDEEYNPESIENPYNNQSNNQNDLTEYLSEEIEIINTAKQFGIDYKELIEEDKKSFSIEFRDEFDYLARSLDIFDHTQLKFKEVKQFREVILKFLLNRFYKETF